jgi:hypothetical protein
MARTRAQKLCSWDTIKYEPIAQGAQLGAI